MDREVFFLSQPQRLSMSHKLTQKQIISQQIIQSIKLMSLSLVELQEAIHEEVEKNPALEVAQEAGETDMPVITESMTDEDPDMDSEFYSSVSDPGSQQFSETDSNSNQSFLEGTVSRNETLYDHLINQLCLINIDAETMNLAEQIICNLDKDGFHREPPSLFLEKTEKDKLKYTLNLVQNLDPVGCACKDWSESLLVQARIRGDSPRLFEVFINKALPAMEIQRFEDVRSSLGISLDDWEDLEEYIRILNPFPGRLYSTDSIQYLIPDLIVRCEEGEHVLVLNDEALPVLRLDHDFEKFKNEKTVDKNAERYINEHFQKAHHFIGSLAQRDKTLLKTAQAIVEYQQEFFTDGPRGLKPLTLKDVAERIGVHEATVSRITSNKCIQTEWGLFELKFFFTNSISGAGSSGSSISKVAAKEMIKEILEEIDSEKKISDQKISNLLARRGIKLARRTVAKYRKELDFPSSYVR